MGSFRWLAATAVLLASIVAITACQGISLTDRRPYEYDTPLTRRLGEFHRQGPHDAQRRMDEFTDFDWDKVHLFGEGSEYRFIDETIGTPGFGRDGRYRDNSGVLLFFTYQGRVTHAVALAPGYLTGDAHTFQRETTVLRAHTMDPGPYQLELTGAGKPTP